MSRRQFEGSDSDSSDEETEVVNFKRARKTCNTEPEIPKKNATVETPNNGQPKRPPPSSSPLHNANVNPNLLLSNGFVHGRRYIDRDSADGDASVLNSSTGRSLANPSAMKAVIDLEKRNADPSTVSTPRPPWVGRMFIRPLPPPASPPSEHGKGEVVPKVNVPAEKINTDFTPSEIMAVMGFTKGQGLAKYLSEVKTPDPKFSIDDFEEKVDALGISLADMELQTIDDVPLNEEIKWIQCSPETPVFKLEELMAGRKVGAVITCIEIDKENAFIDPWVYTELIDCKKLYISLNQLMYQRVRGRSNLFERVGKGPFLCRAAMKMANLDAILDNELSQPKTPNGVLSVGPNGLLYFADVCAGPGGFTEYMLWKKKWEAKGFGFTLKGDLDFDVKNFRAEPETFETFYGEAGDGNIYNPVNVSGYIKHVLESTGGIGVHLMMADGGFTVSKQEFLQEVLSHQIVLSQVFVALAIVRVGGHFLCKLFDVVTPFTVALIYLVHLCFDCVTVHKPLTSRPANSERYLICKWKKPKEMTFPITSYLDDCHQLMWKLSNENEKNESKMSIVELIPASTLTDVSRGPFYIHMRDSNNRLAKKQIEALKRMVPFVRDDVFENTRSQEKAKAKALKHWNIPETIPLPAWIRTCDRACKEILEELPLTMIRHMEKDLTPGNVELLFRSAYDWRFVSVSRNPANNPNRGFYMSLGQNLVYRYDGSQWVIIAQSEPLLELPSKTLLYGEFINEIYGRPVADQTIILAFHIIDAVQLGGVDLRNMHYTQRQETCVKFAKAVTKPGKLPVHAKIPIRMEHLAEFVGKLENRVLQGAGPGAKLVCPCDMSDPHAPFIIPAGLLFLKITKEPWQMALNRQTHKKYFFNTVKGSASEQIPEDAVSGFFNTMGNRVLWPWDQETNVIVPVFLPNDPRISTLNPNRLHTCNMLSYISYTIRQLPSVSPPRTTLYLGTPTEKVVATAAKDDKTNTK